MSVVAVSFMLQRQQYDALERRAHGLALKPSEYARQLYEAAFSARIADERGAETGDAVLDRMVKQAFLLADCEPDFIAKVIDAPVTWVKPILDGWRAYARGERAKVKAAPVAAVVEGGGGKPPVKALPSPQAVAMGEAGQREKPRAYSDADIMTIKRMWAEGLGTDDIAVALGRSRGAVGVWIYTHPGVCPKRKGRA